MPGGGEAAVPRLQSAAAVVAPVSAPPRDAALGHAAGVRTPVKSQSSDGVRAVVDGSDVSCVLLTERTTGGKEGVRAPAAVATPSQSSTRTCS